LQERYLRKAPNPGAFSALEVGWGATATFYRLHRVTSSNVEGLFPKRLESQNCGTTAFAELGELREQKAE